VLKDFVAIEAALVGLCAAFFAYRAAMAKVNYDRAAAVETRRAKTTFVAMEIERCAHMMASTRARLLSAPNERTATRGWNLMLRSRFEANAAMVGKIVDKLADYVPESDTSVMEGLSRRLRFLRHWVFLMGNLTSRHASLDEESDNKAELKALVRSTTILFEGLNKIMPHDKVPLNAHLPYHALARYRALETEEADEVKTAEDTGAS